MARLDTTQLNIRSSFARERAASLARETGMTTTQIVEEALRAYRPPSEPAVSTKLIRKGAILTRPSGGARVSLREADATLDEVRAERG